MDHYLSNSKSTPTNVEDVNDKFMEFLFEHLSVTLFAAFFTTVKVATEAFYDMNPKLRETLEDLEDDVYIENDLDDDFFSALNAEKLPEEQ
ncbi:7623_t:CDS:2 [Racocetra fulgida]|uniref:7623_t:CDS:1 n=1 Tax=Racocetra fulgida TaxID=60492 RepID=A0A9N9AZE1_9GLOM|nr:7623_t:CDS:2 [Racocetra fulgida]